ncbi:MAG TPA: cbb3-type cytochrome c oxidase subunit I [Gaiellaceae bacterium]|nr:cbb3-type cytochrome c oxidase subunit I [Gaiellaceae bacterium]
MTEPVVLDPVELDRSRRLTLRIVLTATAILLVAGLLGMLMRDSQADLGRLPPEWFYALMTAHGLGAFVGWAGFAVMGFAYWVLAQVGFPLGRWGRVLAELTYWLMVGGVLGIVLTTLVFRFGASWVFLYPLPFHGAGAWGDWTAGFFSFSVLLVGLSIVVWCLSILVIVTGPALHAVSKNPFNRLLVSMGFGFIWPRRFATNPRPVPYPVIPLAVIAIDMIIATLPLAVLLVEMIVQSADPGVTVNPLLAKNVLWFFGHPVVYLLLFPAVAVYYLLVPRYAGRPLVAANVITIGWTIAVIANVVVWAHHIYLDYPVGTPQAAINTTMQPLTFSLTIVSALSLYSLFMTMYRSGWAWTGASTAVFLGLVSWLLSGLSGVVNATIAFDVVVHNTLWIVGHFHHMALLNIGFVVFAGTYAFLPELTGKPLYSDALAKWHVWLTFWLALANSAIWYVEGLEGAPRRYAVLPDRYASYQTAGVVVSLLLGAAQLLFVWNLVQTLRGMGVTEVGTAGGGRPPRRKRGWSDAGAEALVMVIVLGLLAVAAFVGWVAGHETRSSAKTVTVTVGATSAATATTGTTTSATTTTTTSGGVGEGNAAAGKAVFASAGCAGCHTLAAADASGNVGPNLDQKKPPLSLVLDRVTNGKRAMPSFKGQLSEQQIKDVAAFVVASTHGG